MKKPFSLHPFLFAIAVIFLFSCKKVNEATLLGDGLVPEVDNINTFDTTFEVETDNVLLNDTAKVGYTYPVALGNISSDPEFGATNAAVYFQVSPSTYGRYPFKAAREKVLIDSIVLSISYIGGYGDTNAPQTVRVYEVTKESTFNDTTLYGYNHPHFQTTGVELGSATFQMSKMDDSVLVVHGDTIKVANQLRIKLDNSLAERFRDFDTTKNPATGGYNNDTLFKDLFRGFAIKADEGTGNGLAYFDLTSAKTGITIFYRTLVDSKEDTAETGFGHVQRFITERSISQGGQANIITRQRSGGWEAYLNNGLPQDDKLYIQSAPGSAGYIKIPGLNGFGNQLIHRAELIATRIPITPNDVFDAPDQLFVAKIGGQDSAFVFHEYLIFSDRGISYNFNSFGGNLRTDDTYRFNITTAVQDVLSRDSSNYTLGIYAPFTTAPFDVRTRPAVPRLIQVSPFPAYGRVLLAGGNYEIPDKRMRLRVIYSKLQP